MNTQTENLQPMQATLEVQITEDKCQKALNDMLSQIDTINYSNDVSAKENINELANSTQQDRNFPQIKTYSNINRILKTKIKNINVKLSTSESDKTKTTRISMNEVIESSSSDDEVYQTRYSVNNKNIFQADKFRSNDCSPIFMGSTSDKESILEKDLNTKTSPTIIHTTAHGEDKAFNNSNSNKIILDVKQQEEPAMNKTNAAIKNTHSLSFTTNYSDDIENNSIPSSNENRNEQFDIKVASDDIVEDFFNGSFDISTYLLKPSLAEQSAKQCMTMMQANTENIHGRNTYGKRIINELVPTRKKNKFSNSNCSKKEPSLNSTKTFTRRSNKKKSDIKKAKSVPKLSRTKKSTESVDKKIHKEEVNLKAFSKGKGKIRQQENEAKDTLYNKEQDLTFKKRTYSPNKTSQSKRNTLLKKWKEDRIITVSPDISNSLIKYPTRSLRNSSLIASKNIKKIQLLENQSDSCEEIDSNAETNSFKSYNYTNSNNRQTRKANERKVKQDNMLSIVENKVQSENEEHEETNDASSYSGEEEQKNTALTSYKKTFYQNSYKTYDENKSLSRKDSLKKNSIPDLNLFDQYFQADINSDISENLKNCFQDKTKDYKSREDNSYLAVNKTEQTNSKIVSSFNKTTKESEHRTWESLEKELLKELDEMPHVDNICKTVMLQEEEVIRKKEAANDTDLFTMSNTSLLQTIRKSITRNKCNMHYEIKSKTTDFGSRADTRCQFLNRISIPCPNETVPSNCKSISILDKTLAAMEKCTVNFISPQVKIFDYEQRESSFQFQDETDNSNHQTQFHKSVTFMANDNKQYYSNEIIGYMKKSKRDNKKINYKQNNMTTVLKDLRDQPKEHEDSHYGHSNNAGHSEQTNSVSRTYLYENYPKKRLCDDKSQALVLNSGGKDNPWSILMKKLNVEDNYEGDNSEHSIPDSRHICKTDKSAKKQINESFTTESNLKHSLNDTNKQINELFMTEINLKQGLNDTGKQINESFMTESNLKYSLNDTNHKDILIPVDEDKNMKINEGIKKQDLKHVVHTTLEPLVLGVYGSKSIKSVEKSNLCEIEIGNGVIEKKNNKDDNKCEKSRELEPLKGSKTGTEINKEPVLEKCKKPLKRSQKYKLRIDRNGSVKIKHSNESSSVSNSSQEFVESKKISAANLKKHKQSEITNNTREKYIRYLKHKLDDQASFIKDDKTGGRSKSGYGELHNISKESPKENGNNREFKTVKLIAKSEDDIFSLSSSDSETSTKM